MTDPTTRRSRVGQSSIPIAVLLLLGLVAGLTYNARVTERAHRATAERALRDYARFASWEYGRQATSRLMSHVHSGLGPAHALSFKLAPDAPLPSAALLAPDTTRCRCGFASDVRFAFRVDLAAGLVTIDRPIAPAIRLGLDRYVSRTGAEAEKGLAADRRDAPLAKWARLDVDTLAGVPHAIAWTVVRDTAGTARAAYGVAANPRAVTHLFKCAIDGEPLLPPSLTGKAPNDSLVRVRVARPDGATLYVAGGETGAGYLATDTLPAWAGRLVTTLELQPRTASALVIGGIPASRLPMQFALLGGAVLLAGVALVQLRRGRELTRLRSQFVANVSHELRTPLTQISMFSETLLLSRERSREERDHFLGVIFREARRLTTLVDSVLRFSRGEAGANRVRPEPRDIASDVRETLRTFAPLAAAAEVMVIAELADEATAMADPGAVRQIVLNLLDNAVKYGPRGQMVTVGAARRAGDVVVWVADQGPGIPPSDRQRVFEAFTRLERPGMARVSGAGIGLAVVHDLVRAHGGRVWVDEAIGGAGARVAFSLPAVDTAEPNEAAADDQAYVSAGR